MMRFIFTALLLLITFGTVDVASAETLLEQIKEIPTREGRFKELTTQCHQGNAEACLVLGFMYDEGKGVTRDVFKAVELYRKACDGKNATGCFNLGNMYRTGDGVRQSVEDALTFYGKACDLKDKDGCQNYARLKTRKK